MMSNKRTKTISKSRRHARSREYKASVVNENSVISSPSTSSTPVNRQTLRRRALSTHVTRTIKNPPISGSFKSSDYKRAVLAALSKSDNSHL